MRITDFKYCSRCKSHKHRDLFRNAMMTKDGKQGWCIECNRLYRIARKAAFLASVEVPV